MPVCKKSDGFTLIELIVGIVALSAALLMLTGVLVPQAKRSTDPWFQVRSSELAKSMMNEISARSFDENSSRAGSGLRCDEVGANTCIASLPDCTASNNWTEEGSRDLYDDVDDFHCFSAKGDQITNIENQSLADIYKEFTVDVKVAYAGADLGIDNRLAKKITVSVLPPRGSAITYASYRTNY